MRIYTFEVTEAATGEKLSYTRRDMPDILLLIKMPGIQGVEVLEYIRKRNLI